jgi:glycosyltransferase involved in cell wall biosynthesis
LILRWADTEKQKDLDKKMDISVIIPTYNRYDTLKLTLQALAIQDYPKDRYEVIVVDDGSKDDTPAIEREPFPFALRYLRQANQGATVARNCAAAEARGDLLVFLDDDISVVPAFLEAFTAAHKVDRIIAVGNLQPMLRDDMSVFERIYGQETATPPSPDERVIIPIRYTQCLTGMFSVKREHFNEIGKLLDLVGDGRVAWGDVDFGYRASKLGFDFVRCMKAVGFHDDFSIRDFNKCAKRWERTSESAVKLFQVYPDIRPQIPMFKDKEPIRWGDDSTRMVARKILRQAASIRPVIWALEKSVGIIEKVLPSPSLLSPLYRWVIGGYIYRGYRSGLKKYGSLN